MGARAASPAQVIPAAALALVDKHGAQAASRPEAWFRALGAAGWYAPRWPVALGGVGLSRTGFWHWQRFLVEQGLPVPDVLATEGIGPLLQAARQQRGTDDLLAGIALGRDRWCLAGWDGLQPDPMTLTDAPAGAGAPFLLQGTLQPVPELLGADRALCLVADPASGGPSAVALALAQPGVDRRPLPGPVVTDPAGREQALFGALECNQLPVGAAALLTFRGGGEPLAVTLQAFRPALNPARTSAAALTRELAELAELLGERGTSDPDLRARTAALGVERAALEALEARLAGLSDTAEREPLALMQSIKAMALASRIQDALADALGYDLLPQPDALRDHNQGPVSSKLAARKVRELLAYRGLAADHDPWGTTRDALGNVLTPEPPQT
jgi:alkylation response protein AidB-like acyl-CoA dehydrogenase